MNRFILAQDKANHMAYGLLLYAMFGLWNTLVALLIVWIVGVAKEVYDSFGNGTKDWKDLLATVLAPSLIEITRWIIT